MSDSATTRGPAITRDAKAWSRVTGTKYTEALRLIEDPLHRGILGDRIVVRDLLRTLDEHPIIGAAHASSTFGTHGLTAATSILDDLSSNLLRQILLSVEFLRMFTPIAEVDDSDRVEADSYTLKHQLEHFLEKTKLQYISNGSMILAAAVLGLPMREPVEFGPGPNVRITLPRHEVDFMRGEHPARNERRRSTFYQPPGYSRMGAVYDRASRNEPFDAELTIPIDERAAFSDFHMWLAAQIDRDDVDVPFVRDYLAGIDDSDHGPATSSEDLRRIMSELPRAHEDWLAASESFIAEYDRIHASR